MWKKFDDYEYEVVNETEVHVKGPNGEFTLTFKDGASDEAILAALKLFSRHKL